MDGMYEQNQMPHSNEAEQSVLGAIIIDPELINTTQEVLLPESFYRGAHQHIFRAMMHLNEDNKENRRCHTHGSTLKRRKFK